LVEPWHRKVTIGELLDALVRNIKLRGRKTWAARARLAGRLTTEVGRMRAADLDADCFERLRDRTTNRKFHAAAQRAGFDGLRFHDLRRSAVTNMVDAGVPDLVVVAISGHRSLGMLKRYFIKNTQRMSEALAATRAYVAGRQTMADKRRQSSPVRSGPPIEMVHLVDSDRKVDNPRPLNIG
jgi:integrase